MLDLFLNKKGVTESMKIDRLTPVFILKIPSFLSFNKDFSLVLFSKAVCNRLLPLMRRRPAGRDIIL